MGEKGEKNMKWDDIISKRHGTVQMPDQRCSFEFIERLYEQIKPALEIRKAFGIPEGADSSRYREVDNKKSKNDSNHNI